MSKFRYGFLVSAAAVGLALMLVACAGSSATSGPGAPPAATSTTSMVATSVVATAVGTDVVAPNAPTPDPLPTQTPMPTEVETRETRLTPARTVLPERVPTEVSTPVTGEVPQDLLEAILEDAVVWTGVARAEFTVVRAESVIWSNGSLGCPESGMMYTDALVDGYWVVLEYDGHSLDYRASDRGFFKLCENPSPLAPGMPGGSDTE